MKSQPKLNIARVFPSSEGSKLRHHFEGGPYLRSYESFKGSGDWAFGYGYTRYFDESGDLKPVGPDMQFTPMDVTSMEDYHVRNASNRLRGADGYEALITRPVSQNEFDALLSFVYNLGHSKVLKSKTIRYINDPINPRLAAYWMCKWNKFQGQPKNGLKRRRLAEACMFLDLPWEGACSPDACKSLDYDFEKVIGEAEREKRISGQHLWYPAPRQARKKPLIYDKHPMPPNVKPKPKSDNSKLPSEVSYGKIDPNGRTKPMEESDRFHGAAEQREGRNWQVFAGILGVLATASDRFIDAISQNIITILVIASIVFGIGTLRNIAGGARRKKGEMEATEALR